MITILKRLFHNYTYNLRLKTKLVISHTILILLPAAVLSAFIFMKLYAVVIDDTIRSEQALSAQTAVSIENLISHVVYASDAMLESSTIHRLFYQPMEDAAVTLPDESRIRNLFHLRGSLIDNSMITGIRIYYDDKVYPNLTQYNSEEEQLFAPMSSVGSSYWFGIFSTSQDEALLCPTLYLTPSERKELGGFAYIARVPYMPSKNDPSHLRNTSAYVAVYFSEETFDAVLMNNATVKGETSYIINSRDVMVSASDQALAGIYYIPHGDFLTRIGSERAFTLISYPEGPAYTAYFPIENTDWFMISLLPESHITDSGNRLMVQLAVAYVIIASAALFIALKLSNSIVDRIIAVAYQMETVHTGRPEKFVAEETGLDEIGVLTDTYNFMTEEINRLMDSQKKASDDLRLAEFRALQAQINPHFLYNTLDMINWLSQTGRKEDVTRAIQTLSRFYKLTLSRRGLMNTIGAELEHVELYVKLQNMRYDNCAGFVVDVPDELLEYTIPKLTFQPIVENAILHGIMAKEDKHGSILLTGWPEGGDIVFVISDNGAGIPPDTLSSMLDETTKETASNSNTAAGSRHIGIYNTNLRLKSLYGSPYGLSFISQPGVGTEVTIRIPARHESFIDA